MALCSRIDASVGLRLATCDGTLAAATRLCSKSPVPAGTGHADLCLTLAYNEASPSSSFTSFISLKKKKENKTKRIHWCNAHNNNKIWISDRWILSCLAYGVLQVCSHAIEANESFHSIQWALDQALENNEYNAKDSLLGLGRGRQKFKNQKMITLKVFFGLVKACDCWLCILTDLERHVCWIIPIRVHDGGC